MFSNSELITFQGAFEGAKEFYGVTTVADTFKGDKRESTSTCIKSTPLSSVFEKHLNGEMSIGISPLKGDNTVVFGAIDIDSYEGSLQSIVRAVYTYDMPICPCFSKSKHLHLFFFFSAGTLAQDAVDLMKQYAVLFRLPKGVEIFPKQTKRSSIYSAYSWINLPYFNSENMEAGRKMLNAEYMEVSLDDFLERMKWARMDIKEHKERFETYPCYDAPPCIVSPVILRSVPAGMRNTWFFSLAVYLKLKDENCDLETLLLDINSTLDNPLEEDELRSTVIRSLQRKTYFYQCSQLADLCDKQLCRRLQYGVGSTKTTGLDYGYLVQINTDPPVYEWEVNGQKLTFESEKQLLQQERFRELCLRYLHIVPRKVDENKWAAIVTKACEHIVIKEPTELQGDFSSGSIFLSILSEFFGEKRRAMNESQIMLGRVWKDEKRQLYKFTADSLLKFVREVKGFKEFKNEEIRRRLIEMRAGMTAGGFWEIPVQSIPKFEDKKVEIDMDLKEGQSEDF